MNSAIATSRAERPGVSRVASFGGAIGHHGDGFGQRQIAVGC
ncbi:MAG: hypothetical protein AAFX52_08120 [Pseudomonadota bacterium]